MNPRRWLFATGGLALAYVTQLFSDTVTRGPVLPTELNVAVLIALAVGFILAGSLTLIDRAGTQLREHFDVLIADAAAHADAERARLERRLDAMTNVLIEYSLRADDTASRMYDAGHVDGLARAPMRAQLHSVEK